MTTTVLASETPAWAEILTSVLAGNEVVVEDDQQPTAVVISYTQWNELKEQKRVERLLHISDDMKNGNFVSSDEVDQVFASMGFD